MTDTPVLSMTNIHKEYFGTPILRDVSLTVQPGEIHALIGENGAGKSTLMNILFGMPVIRETGGFRGSVELDGSPVEIVSPDQAMQLGIGMVHQEFMLLPGFTITENIKLNRELTLSSPLGRIFSRKLQRLDFPTMRGESRASMDRLSMSIDEWLPVAGLPVGYMQLIEVARELDKRNIRLIVLDEPTAVLAESEADLMLGALRQVAASGVGILLISHRLSEVVEVSDRITVLRDGEVVARVNSDEARVEELAELMVGRKIEYRELPPRDREPSDDDLILTMEDLRVNMPGERLRGLNLGVRRGEILGIGGLGGHGKLAVAGGITGLHPATGQIEKDGQPLPLNNPRTALQQGVAFLSEDRRGVGLLLDESIEFNVVLTAMQVNRSFLSTRGLAARLQLRDDRLIRSHVMDMIKELDIRCRGPEQPVRRLSGGNQQKVCVARALSLNPDLLLVSEPTRGIDVGAKQLVLDLLVKLNRELGMTIVITSSELAELRKLCDRIVIIYSGRLAGILAPDASDVDFGLMMAGDLEAHREVT